MSHKKKGLPTWLKKTFDEPLRATAKVESAAERTRLKQTLTHPLFPRFYTSKLLNTVQIILNS